MGCGHAGHAHRRQRHVIAQVHVLEEFVGTDLRVLTELVVGLHRLADQVDAPRRLDPVRGGLFGQFGGNQRAQFVLVVVAGLLRGVARVGQQVGAAGQADEVGNLLVAHGAERDVAVAGRIDADGRVELAADHAPGGGVLGVLGALHGADAVHEAEIDVLPLPLVAMARHERGQRGVADIDAGHDVDHRHAHAHRIAHVARAEREPAVGLHGGVGGGQVAVRAVLAETGDRDVHQAGIALARLFVAQAQAGHDAGPVAFYQHVGLVDQRQRLAPLRVVLQVERDARLAAVEVAEQHAGAALAVSQAAQPVAGRRFDLDDLGAHLAQQAGAVRAGDALAEVQYGDARQCVVEHGGLSPG
ncbi:Uncharacterised protein [Bordetella pertussis]|nr:Uncharacterised protein [Bordetella pertussis]